MDKKMPDRLSRLRVAILSRIKGDGLAILIAILVSMIMLIQSINPPIITKEVYMQDPLALERIDALQKEVDRLNHVLDLERLKYEGAEKKASESDEDMTKSLAILSSLIDPASATRYILVAKKHGGSEVTFSSAYYTAFHSVVESLGVYRPSLIDASRDLIFGNDAFLLEVMMGSELIRSAIVAVASSYKKELELFDRYPKLIESFDPKRLPTLTKGITVAAFREDFAESYDMLEATDREIEDATFFLEFLGRRLEQHGALAAEMTLQVASAIMHGLFRADN